MFTDQQTETLRAAMNCIIPPDNYPGAWEAGAGNYLIRLLESDIKHLYETYVTGLEAINAAAQQAYGQHFAQLSAEQQDVLLTQLEASGMAFFNLLIEHTIEGYYSDPGNGGNQNGIAWQMIGYEVKQWRTTTQSL